MSFVAVLPEVETLGMARSLGWKVHMRCADGRACLRAIGERLQQIGQLGVAVPFHEARHIMGPAPAARLADDRQRLLAKVGQDVCAIARHRAHPRTNAGFFDFSQLRLAPLR